MGRHLVHVYVTKTITNVSDFHFFFTPELAKYGLRSAVTMVSLVKRYIN